jgi:hypothetical protein
MDLINDAVKPWDELNHLLAQPFAYRPDLSDITRLANSIAVVIKHMAEHHNAERNATDQVSPANRLMSDAADAWKHGGHKLRDPGRNNHMQVLSRFEVNTAGEFRFVRNKILIDHATLGKLDFMVNARNAIRYWLSEIHLNLNWPGHLLEGPMVFNNRAVVFYDPHQQLGMQSVRIETVKRAANGKLYPADCSVSFVLVDYHDEAFKQLGHPVIGLD